MKISSVCLIVLLISCFSLKSYSQRAKPDTLKQPRSYWAALGAGGGTLGYVGAVTVNAEIAKGYLLSGIAQYETNTIRTSPFGPTGGKFLNAYNINLQFGRAFKQQLTFFTISAGIGFIHYNTHIDSAYDPDNSIFGTNHVLLLQQTNRYGINIPILLQGYIVIASPVAIGLNAFVNLNMVRTTAGISLTLALGRTTTRYGNTLTGAYPPHAPPGIPLLP